MIMNIDKILKIYNTKNKAILWKALLRCIFSKKDKVDVIKSIKE